MERGQKIQRKTLVAQVSSLCNLFKITRRNLPHWQEPGRVYFITWRCQMVWFLMNEERTITLEAV